MIRRIVSKPTLQSVPALLLLETEGCFQDECVDAGLSQMHRELDREFDS